MSRPLPVFPAAILALAALTSAQQRPVANISGNTATCQRARISPDAQAVAYMVSGRLAVVPTAGGSETTAASGANLGSFVWSIGGTTLFVTDGNQILAAPRSGSGATAIGTLPGQSVNVWAVDHAGVLLYGTRYDPTTSTYFAFSLPVDGSAGHVDLFSSQDVISELRVDITDSYLLFLQAAASPFSPVSLMRANIDGTNIIPMVGASLGTAVTGPEWVDNGDRAIVTAVQPGASLQILRVDRTNGTVVPLTAASTHQRSTLSADGRWIVLESVDGVGGNGPALLPIEGGGEILLHTRTRYRYDGAPSLDALGRSVVFAAQRVLLTENSRVLRIDLDGEMRVYPRAEIGRTLIFDLPAAANEAGAILFGQRSTPFTLNGISFDYDLGPNFAVVAVAPGSGSGPIRYQLPIPNITALQGIVIDFQGLRWNPSAQAGEWTRSGRFPIF